MRPGGCCSRDIEGTTYLDVVSGGGCPTLGTAKREGGPRRVAAGLRGGVCESRCKRNRRAAWASQVDGARGRDVDRLTRSTRDSQTTDAPCTCAQTRRKRAIGGTHSWADSAPSHVAESQVLALRNGKGRNEVNADSNVIVGGVLCEGGTGKGKKHESAEDELFHSDLSIGKL